MASGVVCPGEENRRPSRAFHRLHPAGSSMPACTRGGDYANRMVPIFLALKACRRRLPFTDPFKRGIGASYVVPLYARRNDTLISNDAWSICNCPLTPGLAT